MLGKSFFIKICIFLLPFLFVGSVFAQVPANDECTGATALGSLPTPALCPSGLGAIVTRNGQSNTTATSGATYVYQTNCPVLGTNLPKDVWYSFVATGYQAARFYSGRNI
jgi:hypothetical protein